MGVSVEVLSPGDGNYFLYFLFATKYVHLQTYINAAACYFHFHGLTTTICLFDTATYAYLYFPLKGRPRVCFVTRTSFHRARVSLH